VPTGEIDQHRAVTVPPARRELIHTKNRYQADRRIR